MASTATVHCYTFVSQDPLKRLADAHLFNEVKSQVDVTKRYLDHTNALYLAHQQHVSILQEMMDTTDLVSHKDTIPRESTYDADRQKWLELQDTYVLKLEEIFKMQLDELDRLLICTTYQISQETEPIVRAGRMTALIVIENEKENAEAMVENTIRKFVYVEEQKKKILLPYLRAKNEKRRLHRAYLTTLKKLDRHNHTM